MTEKTTQTSTKTGAELLLDYAQRETALDDERKLGNQQVSAARIAEWLDADRPVADFTDHTRAVRAMWVEQVATDLIEDVRSKGLDGIRANELMMARIERIGQCIDDPRWQFWAQSRGNLSVYFGHYPMPKDDDLSWRKWVAVEPQAWS